jgi:hypothetical protein
MNNSIKTHRLIILILLLLLISSFVSNLVLYSKFKYISSLSTPKTDSLKRSEDNRRLLLQNEADEFFISKDYTSAFAIYEKIAAETSNDSLLLRRQSQTDSVYYSNTDRSFSDYISDFKNNKNQSDTLENYVGSLLQNLEQEKEKRKKSQEELVSQISKLEKMLEDEKSSDSKNENKTSLEFKSSKNVDVKYFGDVKEGKANGEGIGLWTTGSIYEGTWADNKRHGKGKFNWADGEKYHGEYINDFREGNGIYYWKNGERYEGAWKADKRHGYGIVFDKKGKVKLKGNWHEDKFQSK